VGVAHAAPEVQAVPSVTPTDLFWDTLAEHRNQPYYRLLRFRLLTFQVAKMQSADPASGADRPFSNSVLKGIWHVRLNRDPEVVLFYARRGDETVLGMLGSHDDYAWRGHNARAEPRTAARVNNAAARGCVPSPRWQTLRWSDPLDLLTHPDVPELSPVALRNLLEEIGDEQNEGARFESRNGIAPTEADEHEFDSYMEDLERAHTFVDSMLNSRTPQVHWLHNSVEAARFEVPDRILGRS
jgi:hypothetical protein